MAAAAVACKSQSDRTQQQTQTVAIADAAIATPTPPPPPSAPIAWPELADLPRTEPLRVIALPSRADIPRFDVGGPVIIGDLAVIGCSQLGFAAVDWQRGQIAWTKPSGVHLAPPVVHGGNLVLLGDCAPTSSVPDEHTVLGCLRIVTPAGRDVSHIAVHGPSTAVEPFAATPGRQELWSIDDRIVRWRRGDRAVEVDVVTGIARRAPAAPPPLVVRHRDRAWEIEHVDGRIVAYHPGRRTRPAWSTEREYTAMIGAVYLPDQSPMLRIANFGAFADQPELRLFDIDATGSLHGAVSFPVPGISALGFGTSSIGDVAIAVRLDTSLQRDFIAGYAANAVLVWVYPLPETPRADPVGIAIADHAVVVFHDGDTITVLPELSAPPTTPGAARAPLQNPTP
ncbi:MAG: hypothetical protein AB7O24_16945 [Kofleriaceae bacterium]